MFQLPLTPRGNGDERTGEQEVSKNAGNKEIMEQFVAKIQKCNSRYNTAHRDFRRCTKTSLTAQFGRRDTTAESAKEPIAR